MEFNEQISPFGLSDLMDPEGDFIPLLSAEDEEAMNAEEVPEVLPVLPLRNTVLFPGVVIPITVGRDKSIRLIREYYKKSRIIGVVSQKDPNVEDPEFADLNTIGTVAYILKILQMPDGNTTAIIQGKRRFSIIDMIQADPYIMASVKAYDPAPETAPDTSEFKALISSLKDLAIQVIQKSPSLPTEAAFAIKNIESPAFTVHFISSNLTLDVNEKQKILEIREMTERANLVLSYLTKELQLLDLKQQIQNKVKIDLDKQQRDFLLNQQLKTIQEELGGAPNAQELNALTSQAEEKKWSKEVREVFDREMAKLQRMHPAAAEYSTQANYIETLVQLPWGEFTPDNFDLEHAQEVLDEDHYGLEKVKQRIIEYLAVIKLKKDLKSPILCLVGPPGVGKTSLGKSVARALGRKYIRVSLGGLRDESELRGHRKTYIGAMPGRIIQSLKKVKTSNPVFVLDEIDKVSGMNINGDPQAALLEVLDPEQNNAFHDNYLEVEYDLSRIMFIATANTLTTIHPALRDRMEIIELPGYLLEEKIEIANRHLVPKQLSEHGMKKNQFTFSREVLTNIVEDYTRESGVRMLEKSIAKIIRSRAKSIVMKEKAGKAITTKDLSKILGAPVFQAEKSISNEIAGVVTGLAWTVYGGEILFVEASLSQGKGGLTLTGNLGDVMKESASIALAYLKAHSRDFGIDPNVFKKWDIHIHVPEGATPKDGPSAGITMFTALASVFTQRKIKPKLAMTGEITLRGKVLPVGGVREKILAAKRAKITDILLSVENRKDIEEIKKEYIEGLRFHYIDEMKEINTEALMKIKVDHPVKLM
ncbi:MAG TPA: endopeptidase La [Bacteroidales bacterium]|nr:endopeptidase La [Bacteroidales bacterium]HPS73578.1 endopeptidase La [Bacteroidales bacterium]